MSLNDLEHAYSMLLSKKKQPTIFEVTKVEEEPIPTKSTVLRLAGLNTGPPTP